MRWRIFKKKLNKTQFSKRWGDLQTFCSARKTWPQAVHEADSLLDKALKQRRYKGKTTGERLVSAQHEINFNEAVWFSHKFSQKINDVDVRKLKKKDVAMALAGFREALRDLGALEREHQEPVDD
jgi:hypothetical protein